MFGAANSVGSQVSSNMSDDVDTNSRALNQEPREMPKTPGTIFFTPSGVAYGKTQAC